MRQSRTLVILAFFLLSACANNSDNTSDALRQSREKHNPKAAAINVQLGLGYLEQGNMERAKKKLLLALQQDAQSSRANQSMAYYLEKTGDKSGAKHYYQEALYYAPHDGAALNNYGAFLCREKDYQEADRYFLQAVADHNYLESPGAYENAGLCAQADKRYEAAIGYFERAIAQAPNRLTSMMELARLYQQQGRPDNAMKILENYETLAQLNPDLALLGYQISKELKNTNKMEHFEVLLRTRFASTAQYEKYNEMRQA